MLSFFYPLLCSTLSYINNNECREISLLTTFNSTFPNGDITTSKFPFFYNHAIATLSKANLYNYTIDSDFSQPRLQHTFQRRSFLSFLSSQKKKNGVVLEFMTTFYHFDFPYRRYNYKKYTNF